MATGHQYCWTNSLNLYIKTLMSPRKDIFNICMLVQWLFDSIQFSRRNIQLMQNICKNNYNTIYIPWDVHHKAQMLQSVILKSIKSYWGESITSSRCRTTFPPSSRLVLKTTNSELSLKLRNRHTIELYTRTMLLWAKL
jgi:hypothetical protein